MTQIELRLNNGLIRDCCLVSIILIINSIAGAFITTRAGLSIYIIFPIAFAAMPKLFYCAACCISLCILVIFCCAVCMCILCRRVIYCFIFSLALQDKEKKKEFGGRNWKSLYANPHSERRISIDIKSRTFGGRRDTFTNLTQ